LEEGEVASRADAGYGDDGECRGLGCNDRKQDGEGGKVASTEKVVAGIALPARDPESEAEREDEVDCDDREIECVQVRRGWRREKGDGRREKREGDDGGERRRGKRKREKGGYPFSLLPSLFSAVKR
jgi:hypothetical protein